MRDEDSSVLHRVRVNQVQHSRDRFLGCKRSLEVWIYFLKPRNHAIINFLEFRRYYGKTVSFVPCTILAGDQLTWLHERVHKTGAYRQEQEPVPFEPHGTLCDGYV